MIKEIKELSASNIKSIRMDWFWTENGLELEKKAVQYNEYDVKLSSDKLKVNKIPGVLRFIINDNGEESTVIIKQFGYDVTMKSDAFFDGDEGIEYPVQMYVSDGEIVFVRKDKYERQFVYVSYNH